MKMFKTLAVFSIFFLGLLTIAQNPEASAGGDEARPIYGYYYKDTFVALHASKQLVVIKETGVSFTAFVKNNNLKRDPLSDQEPLEKRNLGLYRLPPPISKTGKLIDLNVQMELFAQTTDEEIQPVFEQGQALLIPSDEVIVGFKEATTLDQAQEYFSPHLSGQGIIEVREHREDTYILKIDNPSNGRAYQVCQFFANLDQVRFAEPNHIVVMLYGLNQLNEVDTISKEDIVVVSSGEPMAPEQPYSHDTSTFAAPTWSTIASLNFESPTFPPAGWQIEMESGATDAYWGRTDYRAHNGSYSMYCAQSGSAAVSPPGPVPIDMLAYLRSPTVDLTVYEEVYVEAWFYAKNDLYPGPGGTLYDYASFYVYNSTTNTGQ